MTPSHPFPAAPRVVEALGPPPPRLVLSLSSAPRRCASRAAAAVYQFSHADSTLEGTVEHAGFTLMRWRFPRFDGSLLLVDGALVDMSIVVSTADLAGADGGLAELLRDHLCPRSSEIGVDLHRITYDRPQACEAAGHAFVGGAAWPAAGSLSLVAGAGAEGAALDARIGLEPPARRARVRGR